MFCHLCRCSGATVAIAAVGGLISPHTCIILSFSGSSTILPERAGTTNDYRGHFVCMYLLQACRGGETPVKPGPSVHGRLVHIYPCMPATKVSGRGVILQLLLLTAAREAQENGDHDERAERHGDGELPESENSAEGRAREVDPGCSVCNIENLVEGAVSLMINDS